MQPQMSAPVGNHMLRTSFFGFAYPPSKVPLADLQPIDINKLRLETHHRGKVLILRAFGHPIRMQSVQNAFEDAKGNVDRLALYNEDFTVPAEELLPKGVVVAVKEPYCKASADGGYTIRIDHPSDLIVLQHGDPSMPAAFAFAMLKLTDTPASHLKTEGNNAYLKKEYKTSLDHYNRALKVCMVDDEVDLKFDLLRNRAVVNLNLQRYEAALDDALKAVVPMSHLKAEQYNFKAYYRAGRAAYELQDFEDAHAHFMKAIQMQPKDEQALTELKRTDLRLGEQKNEQHDFASIGASVSKKKIRLDHTSFSGKVVMRDAGNRGRGLFSVREIKAGELILCEKAFHVDYGWESNADGITVMLNVNTNRAFAGPRALLFLNIVKQLRQNPQHAGPFLHLYAGGYHPRCTAAIIDNTAVIDIFQTQAIIEHNVFGCPDIRSLFDTSKFQSEE